MPCVLTTKVFTEPLGSLVASVFALVCLGSFIWWQQKQCMLLQNSAWGGYAVRPWIVECKKNRRWDSALRRAGGIREGRREYSLLMNCLRMIDKKVDSPENQSWVNVEFQKFACHEEWLYGIEGRRKVSEKNSDKWTWFFNPQREAGDVWCLPPVWNLRAVIWFPFPISCHVFFCLVLLLFLPCHFSANGPFSWLFSRKLSNIFC